jgi:Holliday junction resolvase
MENNHPYFNKRKPDKAGWRKQEKKLAKDFGGKRQPASGATPLPFLKGDISTPELLIEAKSTDKKSYTLHQADLNKLVHQAAENGKNPVLCLSFHGVTLDFFIVTDWAIIPKAMLLELLEGVNGRKKASEV